MSCRIGIMAENMIDEDDHLFFTIFPIFAILSCTHAWLQKIVVKRNLEYYLVCVLQLMHMATICGAINLCKYVKIIKRNKQTDAANKKSQKIYDEINSKVGLQ